MADDFKYDVFLSHSSKDKGVARDIAERLQADGLKVWFEDWRSGLRIKKADRERKTEEGLQHSRVLVLCMSANAFGSEWAQLEAGTFRFRDPQNKERRFIPLRLDEAPVKDSLMQFNYVNWLPSYYEQEYAKLLEACRPPAPVVPEQTASKSIQLNLRDIFHGYAFSPDGKRALTGDGDKSVRLWDLETGHCLRVFKGHTSSVWSIVWSTDESYALSCGGQDKTVRLWDIETGQCLHVLRGHSASVRRAVWSADQQLVLSSAFDGTLRLWDARTEECLRVIGGDLGYLFGIALSADQKLVLSSSSDKTVRLWNLDTGMCLRVFEGHTKSIIDVVWGLDQRFALSISEDNTLRMWNVETGRCLRVLEGHIGEVVSVALSTDQRYALSGSVDKTVRLWDLYTGNCLCTLRGHMGEVVSVAWSADQHRAFSGDYSGGIQVWDLSELITEARVPTTPMGVSRPVPDQIQYTNAKVLLVGESGAGKTGLSKRLALNDWQPSDSTVGAWATQWKLPMSSGDGVEREIWLWDFGGQADQRLIHQLYMEDTALAVLVFDGQKEDLFDTLGQWDRDLTRASRKTFSKLLVAGRVDAGGLRVSRNQVESFWKERGFSNFLETSAKIGTGCEELKQAIIDGIRWENIPWRSSPVLFKRLKEEIVLLKDAGRVLMRFNELRNTLTLSLSSESARFTDDELKAVISLLAGPGVVWELKFGSWVLLQPERINAYAQAVIQTVHEDEHERGCLPEERVLSGDLTYYSSMARLEADEERFVLLAMHQTLVERGLCLREQTEKGPLLIFPSYYRRERPELLGHPSVLVSYRFNGFLDDIYATLVVRLHHTESFERDDLWRYAADFKSLSQQRRLGIKMTRRAEGAGELEVYFDPNIPVEEKMIFSRYVHEHLLKKGTEVVRLRHYVCPHCKAPVRDRETAMERLADKGKQADILCVKCEKRVPLWDDLEERFAAPEIHQHVLELDKQSQIVLDNADKERTLVGEVTSTVALAGQICRELTVGDNGIDMEIEFKTDAGNATGRKVYLQLKSGDSYLKKRESDGAEIFKIEKARHADYWREQAFHVLLVIRTAGGEIRWMEIRDWLRRESDGGKKWVKQIVFKGERFDVMSVRRWRDKVLGWG